MRTIGWASTAAAAVLAALLVAPSGAAAPDQDARGPMVTGLTVPWAIGGIRYEADGTLVDFPGEWPTVPFGSLRIWDSRTAWLNIEPRNGTWDFSRLDQFVAKSRARGVADISLVLGGTPRWAAAQVRPMDAHWMGPGSASPPRRMSDWAEFVTAVAQRYRGRITSYEIWNEPNNVTFWSGTRAQWSRLVDVAAQRIRAADPSATIVASGFRMTGRRDVAGIGPWLDALGAAGVDIDAVSFHWYPQAGSDTAVLADVVRATRARARAAGLPGDVWVTEANVRRGQGLPAAGQRRAVAALSDAARAGGAARLTWYAWTDLGPPDVMLIHPGTPAARAIGVQSGG
ncbi:MAG: cellulase family glycosylhydrolase [Candidatus Nanopelagicales bacterium]